MEVYLNRICDCYCGVDFLGAFSTVFDGMGALGGIVLGVGVFLAFEMVICTGVILSKLNTDEDR